MGRLLFDWIPDYGLPANQLVRTKPSDAASQTAQPAALSTAAGDLPVSAPPDSWAGGIGGEMSPHNCLRMPEARAVRRAGCGKSASPVRRGEGHPFSVPSYSTGSESAICVHSRLQSRDQRERTSL